MVSCRGNTSSCVALAAVDHGLTGVGVEPETMVAYTMIVLLEERKYGLVYLSRRSL